MRCYVSFMEGSLTIIFPLWAQVIQLCCCFQGIWFLVAIGLCTCFVCSKFGYQSETMMILNIMILAAQRRMPLMPFFFPKLPIGVWYDMDNFGIRKSTQFPCTSHQFLLYHIYTSNVWLQPVTYAGRLNLSSWLAISSSGGLSSRILGFALMTVCVCNPVSMSPGKNLRSYLVKRILRENHMSHRQGNHFDS